MVMSVLFGKLALRLGEKKLVMGLEDMINE